MSQHDYVIADQSHTAFRADLNLALAALVGTNSGATAPATMYAYMLWADTTAGLLKIRDSTNSSWLTIGPIAPTQATQRSFLGIDADNLGASVAASALTITLKSAAGADGSSALPIPGAFRSATLTSGAIDSVNLTAAQSLVLSSGSTMGATSGVPFRLWIVEFNDAGTRRLGAVNCLSGKSIMQLSNDLLYSSTAEGGAGAADSAQVIYSAAAVTSKAITVKGYLEWSSGLATAGTWSSGPTKIQDFGPGVPLPGAVVQTARYETGASSSLGSTAMPIDDTIPTVTEGNACLSLAVTPKAACNVLERACQLNYYTPTATDHACAMYQDSAAADAVVMFSGGTRPVVTIANRVLAGTTSSTTTSVRAGSGAGAAGYLNGTNAPARLFGGVLLSWIQINELMA